MKPRTAGDAHLVAPATVPESGSWYHTDRVVDGLPVLARVPLEGEGHEDENALALAWERVRNLEHPALPRAVAFDPSTQVMLVAVSEGVPLRRLLEHRTEAGFTMTPSTVLDLGLALADLLVHTHEKGRPHGHLSPDAIWITAEGELVVWGFGEGPDAPGPARWWAPERARGKRASGDADQWALGAIVAALVTARVPWRSDDPITEARVGDASHLYGPVLDQWKPLGRLVERMLAPEPRDRFPSIHPVRQSLLALRQRVPGDGELPRLGALLASIYGAPVAPPALLVEPHGSPEPVTTISEEPPPLDAYDDALEEPPVMDLQPSDFEIPTDFGTSPTRIPDEQGPPSRIDELPPMPPLELPPPLPAVIAPPLPEDLEPPTSPFEELPLDVPSLGLGDTDLDALPPLGEPVASGRAEASTLEPDVLPVPAPSSAPWVEPESEDAPSSDADARVQVAEVDPDRGGPADDLDWYERVDARVVAPWVVGALGVVLVVYILWSVA